MQMQKVRLNEQSMAQLRKIADEVVLPSERHINQRHDTTLVGPLIRLIAEGTLVPVRLPSDTRVIETLIGAYVDEGGNLADPQQAGILLTKLLALIAQHKIKLVRGGSDVLFLDQ